MNVAVHISAAGALVWLSLYCFNTLSNGVLGVAVMGLSLTFMLLAVMSFGDDQAAVRRVFPKRGRR